MSLHELEIVVTAEYYLDHCAVFTTKQLILCVLNVWITSSQLVLSASIADHIAPYAHVLLQSTSNKY